MKFAALKDVTGKWLRESFTWLVREQAGCCSICFATDDTHNYAVCVGWHSYDDACPRYREARVVRLEGGAR